MTAWRETKVFQYYGIHPVRPVHLRLAEYISNLLMLAVSLSVLLVVDEALFGLRYDGETLFILLSIGVTFTAFFALGFALAGLTPTVQLAQALGSLLFFPMMMLSGFFGPRDPLLRFLKLLSDLNPMTHATDLLTGLWVSGSMTPGDALSHALHSSRARGSWGTPGSRASPRRRVWGTGG